MDTISMIAENYFSNVKEISSNQITLSEDVLKMCEQNRCGHYGKNWMCPPAVKSIDEFRDDISEFDSFIIVSQVYDIESSLDWTGMMSGIRDFRERIAAAKKEIENKFPGLTFLVLGAGSCSLCKPCTYIGGEPCRRPEEALVSVEACGIDVIRLMRDNGLKYYHGKNTVTYIGGIIYPSLP